MARCPRIEYRGDEHRTERKEDGGCIMKPMNEHGMLNKKKIDSILF